MKPFDKLTGAGKLRRLRQVVIHAMANYDIEIERVRLLVVETNTMFLVRSKSGEKFVLRIYSDDDTTLKENHAEVFWLNAIKRDTNLNVSEPIARRDGGYITLVTIPQVPGQKRCILFNWVPGRQLENYLRPQNYFKLGQLMARLHDHAETLGPLPADIKPLKWDRVFYFPDEPVLFNTLEFQHLFPPERIEIMNRVIERATETLQRLHSNKAGRILIHSDLHYWNVHYHKGELYALDFEGISHGYPIQDIAITLYYGRDLKNYKELREAFEKGYRSLRRWPSESEKTIQTLIAARAAMFANYAVRIFDSPEEFVSRKCKELGTYLEFHG